jgi:hypothetical protein
MTDTELQERIADIGRKVGVVCPQGGSWRKDDGGYRCGCSGHFLTYEQLGVDQGQARDSIAVRTSTGTGKKFSTFVGYMLTLHSTAVTDTEVQERITEVGKKVAVVCPKGGSWRLEDGGYRCGCSGHFLTFEQLGLETRKEGAKAPIVADVQTQQRIADVGKKVGVICPQGYDWRKTDNGWRCAGGGHFLSFEQLEEGQRATTGVSENTKLSPIVADTKTQQQIAIVGKQLGVICPQGFAWHKTDDGWRCAGGSHFLSFKQLGGEIAMKEVVQKEGAMQTAAPIVADAKTQQWIVEIGKRVGVSCPKGLDWYKTIDGWRCADGGHFISFKQFQEGETMIVEETQKAKPAPIVADAKMQQYIIYICRRVGVVCPQGLDWYKVDDGWRCADGAHFVSFKQFQEGERIVEEETQKAKSAPTIADTNTQQYIIYICRRVGVVCPQGLDWYKVDDGWRCADGAHFVSFQQFQEGERMVEEETQKAKSAHIIADAKTQQYIVYICKRVGIVCPHGLDWYKTEDGWRCADGSHFISFKQFQEWETRMTEEEGTTKSGPIVADAKTQQQIAYVCHRYGIICLRGYAWYQTEDGWRCADGDHFISFKQFQEGETAVKEQTHETKSAPIVADAETQQQIADIGKRVGVICPQGFDWHKTDDGWRCAGGGHFLSFKQLEEAKKGEQPAIVADAKTQQQIAYICHRFGIICLRGYAWYKADDGWRCADGDHFLSSEQLREGEMMMEEERKAKEFETAAPIVADAKTQQQIADIGKQVGVICPQGYGWHKTDDGWRCAGGGHFLSFQQLEEGERKAKETAPPIVADADTQQQIADVGKRLGVICPQGFDWHKTDDGWRCAGGGHFLSFKQLQEAEEADAKMQQQIAFACQRYGITCLRGYAWFKADDGWRCADGDHFLSFEQLQGETITETHQAKAAPVVADTKTQQQIADVGKRLGVICPQGFDWHKTDDGWRCAGGGHFLSFKQIQEAEQPIVADAETQKQIAEIGKQVGVICPQGFDWHKTDDGWRCAGGGHFLSFQQLEEHEKKKEEHEKKKGGFFSTLRHLVT